MDKKSVLSLSHLYTLVLSQQVYFLSIWAAIRFKKTQNAYQTWLPSMC